MLKKVNNWLDTMHSAYGQIVKLIAIVTFVFTFAPKVYNGLNSGIEHFEENKAFREKVLEHQKQDSINDVKLFVALEINAKTNEIILEKKGEFFFIADSLGGTIRVSDALTRASGRPFELVKDYNWINFVHSRDKVVVRDAIQQTVKSKADWECYFLYYMNNTYLPIKSEARRILYNGKIMNYVGTLSVTTPEIYEARRQ